MPSQGIYDKDSKPYYGGDSLTQTNNSGYTVIPKIFTEANNRYGKNNIYQKDQQPYYGTGEPFKVISNAPTDRIPVAIEMKDLTQTFPDQNNIRILENALNQINAKESLNSISMTGKYMKDAKPYYDPTTEEKAMKSAAIIESINRMKAEMTYDGPVFTEENFPVKTKVQNYANFNKEDTNEFIANSYHYPVDLNSNYF